MSDGRCGTSGLLVLDAPGFHRGEHHDRLAEAHLVGEAAAEPEAPQEREPAERVALVVAQDAMKGRWRIDGADSLESRQLAARPREGLVRGHSRLRREPRVEQRTLTGREAHVVRLCRADRGQASGACEPLLRQLPERAVTERDEGVAAARRSEERGQVGADAVEVDTAVQLEPVDTGPHVEGHEARPAIEPAFGFYAPALRDEHADECRQRVFREVEPRAARPPVCQPARAERLQPRECDALGREIPPPGQSPLAIEEDRLYRQRIHVTIAVSERQLRVESTAVRLVAAAVAGWPRDADTRLRLFDARVDSQLVGALEPRRIRGHECFEERRGLLRRHRDGPHAQEPSHPPLGATRVERGDPRGVPERRRTPHDERCSHEQDIGEGVCVSVAADDAADRVAGVCVPRDLQLELGGLRIPLDRHELGRRIRRARGASHQQPIRVAQPFGEIALQCETQDECGGHGQPRVVSTPGWPGVPVRVRGPADRVEDPAIALVGQPRDVVAIDGHGLRSGPGPGLFPLARQELDDQPAGRHRTREIENVNQLAGQNRPWRDGVGRRG